MIQAKEIARALREAAGALAARCDGARERDHQGFNAVDTDFGKALAQRPVEEWEKGTVVTAYRMLRKYKAQLSGMGIEFDEIPEPEVAGLGASMEGGKQRPQWYGNEEEPSHNIQETDGKLHLWFDYDEDLIEEIKGRARGRRYDRGSGAWILHMNPTNAALTAELAHQEGWSVEEGLMERLEVKTQELTGVEEEEPRAMVWGKDEKVRVRFEYNTEIIGTIKRRTAPRWYDEESTDWIVEANDRNAFVLLEAAAKYGFDIEEDLEEKLTALAHGTWSERQARWNDQEEKAELEFPPVDEVTRRVKKITGRTFVPDEEGGPHWKVPLTLSTASALLELIGDFRFQAEEALMEAINRQAKQAERRLRLSAETDGNRPLEVEKELGYDLYGYQRAGVRYAQEARSLIIGDQMGLGKTITALAAAHSLDAYPLLVICPSTVKTNWIREAYQCLPAEKQTIRMSLLEGLDPEEKGTVTVRVEADGRRREVTVPTNDLEADLLVTNYAILGPYVDQLSARGMETVVLDESHKVKNPDAKRSQRSAEVMQTASLRLLLTGTPVRNRPKEWFNQLKLIGRAGSDGTEFGTFFPWAKRYCDAEKTRWGWDFSGASNVEELNRELRASCYVRREKSEVRDDLPDVQEDIVEVDIENRREYQRAAADVLAYVQERLRTDEEYFDRVASYLEWDENDARDPEDLIEEKVRRGKRGKHLVEISVLREIVARGKEEVAVQWATDVLESGEKLVLFAIHRPMQKALMEALSDYEPAHIFAGDRAEERDRQIERFRDDSQCRVMIASLGAAKEGVDGLQEVCSMVGFAELPWSPADLDQATARLHRIGQEADMVNVYYLIAPRTIDEHIYDLVEEKRGVVERATEGNGENEETLKRLRKRMGETGGEVPPTGSEDKGHWPKPEKKTNEDSEKDAGPDRKRGADNDQLTFPM